MTDSLEDMFEGFGEFSGSRDSQKAHDAADISRTFMCKLDNDTVFVF